MKVLLPKTFPLKDHGDDKISECFLNEHEPYFFKERLVKQYRLWW